MVDIELINLTLFQFGGGEGIGKAGNEAAPFRNRKMHGQMGECFGKSGSEKDGVKKSGMP